MARRQLRPILAREDPLYKAWVRMRSRARGTANAASVKNYLERGIKVCARWEDYDAFAADMGPKPDGAWLDRIDNSKGYEPGNCRWATPTEQQRNRRNNRLFTIGGETMCLAAWAERYGINRLTLWQRLNAGMSIETALTKPVRSKRPMNKEIHT